MRLAVSRTPRARGRIKRLIVLRMTSTGVRGRGKCPIGMVGWLSSPIMTVISQRGAARAMFRDSSGVGI